MKTCILCKKDKKFGRRYYYGFVCSDCKKSLPNLFSYKRMSEEQINWLYKNSCEKKSQIFRDTARLGNFYLDEDHALISVKGKKDRNMLSIMDMSEISIEPTNIRLIERGTNVFCDVVLSFKLNCGLYFKGIIKVRELCNVKVDMIKNSVKAEEPLTISLMRSMMNQAIENQYANGKLILEKVSELDKLRKQLEETEDITLARGVLMLNADYTKEELKEHRNALVKAFHPDNNKDKLSNEFTDKINASYKILNRKETG